MLRFVLHKLLNKRWMAICLLIGNLLIMAVAASNPTYSDAVLQRTLTRILSQTLTRENTYPAEITMQTKLMDVSVTEENMAKHNSALNGLRQLPQQVGVPLKMMVEEYSVSTGKAFLMGSRATGQKADISIGYLKDADEHIELISGSAAAQTVTDGVIEAVASERLLQKLDVLLGESYELRGFLQPDGKTPYQLKIVGVYGASDPQDLFWDRTGAVLSESFLISRPLFEELFVAGETYPHGINVRCSAYLDYTKIAPDQVQPIMQSLSAYKSAHIQSTWTSIYENISKQLEAFLPEATRLTGTLTVLQGPIFVLLAAFIFMVSKQMMEMEENEIAVLKSRGAKKQQIFGIYSLQALVLALAGFLLGYPVSFLMVNLLGSSNAFLEFVQRSALPIRFTGKSVLFGLLACAASWATMTLPVLPYTGMTIVQHKVRKQTNRKAPWWQRCFLDVILIAVSLYALYSFNQQKEFLAQKMALGGALDPLLYFSSSVFILGVGLLGMRLVPLLVRAVFWLFKRLWSPALYAGFLRVLRTRNNQSFIMIFLILTIALGIFNMSSARSINGNAEQQIVYMDGSDVVVQEVWESIGEAGFLEPSFERFRTIAGVESLTKVYCTAEAMVPATKSSNNISDVVLMGINTREFGETANFDSSLLPTHWNHYLNAISQDPQGILVSSTFRDVKGYREGDILTYKNETGMLQGVIYGFVDYWPGFAPMTMSQSGSGEAVQSENYLIVANLSYLQSEEGILPYQVWMKMEGSTQPVYDFAAENHIRFAQFRDTAADLIQLKNEPVFQGTNGVLTSNFIIVLLLCMVGFLIYWILSIRTRELQFGIFRAMGMSLKEVIGMLLCEQVLISGSAIVVGILAGVLATRLYLPLIQVAYSGAVQILPIRMITYTSDAVRLFVLITGMMVICMSILAWLISKIRIAQALKLGED